MTTTYVCPVCGFPGLEAPPTDEDGDGNFEYCPSCGFQFGVTDDDRGCSYAAWRERWVRLGMPWDSAGIEEPPLGWNPPQQLANLLRSEDADESER